MHSCPNCRQRVEDNILYCPNCGALQHPQSASFGQDLRPQEHQITSGDTQPYPRLAPLSGGRNPWISAILNFFLPGLGYVYNGLGSDKSQIVFGSLIFVSVFIGLFIPIFGAPSSSAGTAAPTITVIDLLALLVFVIPFALAYDGYVRANRMNRSPSQ
ncbi:MAG: zinc-ribbon domain-containing protein [Nitrososphaerales archaeon]